MFLGQPQKVKFSILQGQAPEHVKKTLPSKASSTYGPPLAEKAPSAIDTYFIYIRGPWHTSTKEVSWLLKQDIE